MAGPPHRKLFAHQPKVPQTIEFGIIRYAGFAVAKADLGPDIKIDLDAAVRGLAAEGFTVAPFVGRVGPLHFRKPGMVWRRGCAAMARHRPGEEYEGPRQSAQCEANDPCNDRYCFHCFRYRL